MAHTISLVVSFVLIGATKLMMKTGARAIEAEHRAVGLSMLASIKSALLNPWIMGGVACGAMSLAAYTFALRRFPVNLAYPIKVSLGYAIIVCGSRFWLKEQLSVWQMVGVGVILAGVWIVASGMGKTA